jgi:hypothetical protein
MNKWINSLKLDSCAWPKSKGKKQCPTPNKLETLDYTTHIPSGDEESDTDDALSVGDEYEIDDVVAHLIAFEEEERMVEGVEDNVNVDSSLNTCIVS